MLTSRALLDKVNNIVEDHYLNFTYKLIGDNYFSDEDRRKLEAIGLIVGTKALIDLIYLIVRTRPAGGYSYLTLNEVLDKVRQTGVLPVLNDTHQASIDNARADINEAIESSKNEIRKKIRHEIIKANDQFKNDVAIRRIDNIPNLEDKKTKYGRMIIIALAGIAISTQDNFIKAFTTALTGVINNATVDQITSEAMLEGKSIKETLVYKHVVNDSKLCMWCNQFYVNEDGTPKIYKLADLQANGSNLGRPKSAWRPVLGPTHPRCRCQLFHKKQ